MKSISSMCFGCEPLGGNDWGDVNVNTIKPSDVTSETTLEITTKSLPLPEQ